MATASRLGVLSLFDHYPALVPGQGLCPRLSSTLIGFGLRVDSVAIVDLHAGQAMPDATDCDAWLISGPPDCTTGAWIREGMADFLLVAEAAQRPVFGTYHGEHAIHLALCPNAAPPCTRRWPTRVRNPLLDYTRRDCLFAFDRATGMVLPARHPFDLRRAA